MRRDRYFPTPFDVVLGALVIGCLVAFAVISCTEARADTNLSQICTDAQYDGQEAQACINGPLAWASPGPNELVLTRPAGSSSEWAADTIWRKRSAAIAPMQIRTCSSDLNPPALHGGVNGTYVGDPCTTHVWVTAAPQGQDVTVTCTPPTKNTDGSAIAGAQLPIGFFFWETPATTPPADGIWRQVSPMVPGCNYVFPNLEPGNHLFIVETVDKTGALSAPSNVASKMVTAPGQPIPTPPTNVTGTVASSAPLAWTTAIAPGTFAPIAIGTAKAGAVCDKTMSMQIKTVNGGAPVYKIAVADVDLLPGVVPIIAFAPCG